MRNIIVLFPLVMFIFVGCQRDTAIPQSNPIRDKNIDMHDNKILKIKVAASGEITANNQSVTLEQLANKLDELKNVGGQVWLLRCGR